MPSAFKPPVFIVGCPRSGTTLLYHILLSSGGFAIYRAETHAFDLIGPKFGDLRTEQDRRAFLAKWFDSYRFTRTGLDREVLGERILRDCRNTGDFLRVVMESIAEAQDVDRWADCTPQHGWHLAEIKAAFPDAKIIHIIRDGRDAALSLAKLGWISPFPWDRERGWVVAGLFWKWAVEAIRNQGRRVAPDYHEVRFEDLVANPADTAARIGRFIGHEIDYDRVRASGVGSVSEPNTSFAGEAGTTAFNPLGRWRGAVRPDQVPAFEAAVGDLLAELGYAAPPDASRRAGGAYGRTMGAMYPAYFALKQWMKSSMPLRRHLISTDLIDQRLPPPT